MRLDLRKNMLAIVLLGACSSSLASTGHPTEVHFEVGETHKEDVAQALEGGQIVAAVYMAPKQLLQRRGDDHSPELGD